MGLIDKWKGVRYRIRIFDNFLHITSIEVPEKGQRYVTVTIHKELFGLGEKTKLAFEINPKIKPKMFGGNVMELDFDIRDAVPLADLLDILPEYVVNLNDNYRKSKEVIDVQPIEKPELEKIVDQIQSEPEPESERRIDTVITAVKSAADNLNAIMTVKDSKDKEKIDKCLALCKKYPKLLYWLPEKMDIGQEIHGIVMQSAIYRVGVLPSYYIAQANAMISEKTLTRPEKKEGWEQVALILGVIGLIVVGIIVTVYFLTHPGA